MDNYQRYIALRFAPAEDVKVRLQAIVDQYGLGAAAIISAVGSLTQARLRAGSGEVLSIAGPLEIVSLSGTLGDEGLHVHLAAATVHGTTFGGHLMPGCIINTTLELVILNLTDLYQFARVDDSRTGYKELEVRKKGGG